ncbi:MAG TPA: hypothetical protein VIT83_02715 [Gammaproteobacteria bacterium]
MNNLKLIFSMLLTTCLFGTTVVQAHGQGTPPEGMIVTRHFTGIWDQVDHEAQGIALQVIEQLDDSRRAVAYWYTYDSDREAVWYMAIGDLIDNRIAFQLYESTDVGFLQEAIPGNDSVHSIGTMTIVFDSCQSGEVTYETDHPEVGSGSFHIERLLEVMNTHCTGGISDDMHADTMFGEQYMALSPAREGINGSGHARYQDYPDHMEFEIETNGLPDGTYHLYMGMQDRGEFSVENGYGAMRFSSPVEDGRHLLNFDPRGMGIEIRDETGVVLSSFGEMMDEDDHHGGDGGHHYACDDDSGHGPGTGGMGGMGGMGHDGPDCVDDGGYLEIEVDLENTGILADAEGEAEWDMNSERVMFAVEIEGVPAGGYPLRIDGVEVGTIQAFARHNGEIFGRLGFRDPAVYAMPPLDFDPRGKLIEVLQGDSVILQAELPAE